MEIIAGSRRVPNFFVPHRNGGALRAFLSEKSETPLSIGWIVPCCVDYGCFGRVFCAKVKGVFNTRSLWDSLGDKAPFAAVMIAFNDHGLPGVT